MNFLNTTSKICRQSSSQIFFLQFYRPENESRLSKFLVQFTQSKFWPLITVICILGNTGNIQIRETFFVAFMGADCNKWLWNYKVTRFTVFVRGRGEGWWKFVNVPKSYKCEQGGRVSKFWSFCDNVIIECPLIFFQRLIHKETSRL